VAARYILAVLSIAFLIASGRNWVHGRDWRHPQTRTWLMVGAIFALVSIWLFTR
jgi:hypothetical protein